MPTHTPFPTVARQRGLPRPAATRGLFRKRKKLKPIPEVEAMMAANRHVVGPGRSLQDILDRPAGYTAAPSGVNPAVGGIGRTSLPILAGSPAMASKYDALAKARREREEESTTVAANMRASALPFGMNEVERARWIAERPLSPAVAKWNEENADPARAHAAGLPPVMPLTAEGLAAGFSKAGEFEGGLTKREFLDVRKARKEDLASDQPATYVGPMTGRFGERNVSTTEMLRQRAEDNPEGPEAKQLARMERRFEEKRAGLLPIGERRELRRMGKGLPGQRQRDILAGRRDTPEEQAIAAQTESYRAAAAGEIGGAYAGSGEAPPPDLIDILRGPQEGQGLRTLPPPVEETERKPGIFSREFWTGGSESPEPEVVPGGEEMGQWLQEIVRDYPRDEVERLIRERARQKGRPMSQEQVNQLLDRLYSQA